MSLIKLVLSTLLIGSLHGFDLGKKYVFKYETDVGTIDGNKGTDVSKPQTQYKLQAEVNLIPVWMNPTNKRQLVQIAFNKPQSKIVAKGKYRDVKSEFQLIQMSPIYVYSMNGEIKEVFCDPKELGVSKNIKKSVFTLLSQQGVFEDDDMCKITRYEEGSLKKVKKDCLRVTQPKKSVSYIRTVLVESRTSEEYEFDLEGNLKTVTTAEQMEMFSPLWSNANVSVQSQTHLKLEDVLSKQSVVSGADIHEVIASLNKRNSAKFVEESGISFGKAQTEKAKCDLETTVNKHKKLLRSKDVGKSSSASAFSTFLKCVRQATKKEIKSVLENKKLTKALPQLLDIVAFAGTDDAVDAAFETLRFVDGDLELINRFLLSFATNIHPTRKMLISVQKTLNQLAEYEVDLRKGSSRVKEEKLEANEQITASLISALGGLAKMLNIAGNDQERQLIEEVDAFLKESIKSCISHSCILTYLKAIRSMALPSSTDLLLSLTSIGGKVSYEALSTLREMGFQNDPQCEKFCHRIFHEMDKKENTENRILAAEMLMDCYTDVSTLQQLLSELQDQKQFEMTSYLTSRITHKMEEDAWFKKDVLHALKQAKQYYSLAQKGDSVYFKNQAIHALSDWSKMSGVNGTYSVGIELTTQGVLNRHHTDIFVYTPGGSERLISASSYTEGLSTFFPSTSDEPVEEDTDVEPSAALDLVVSGIALPPVVFFKGVGDMMNKALSSENSVPEIRGNYLVAEYSDEATLLNGLPVAFQVEAIVSNAIYGSFEMSFWSQTSKTAVTDEVALRLEGSASVLTDFMELESQLTLQSEFNVAFVSNAQFYEQPYLSCTEASHKDIHITYEKKTSSGGAGSGFSQRRTKRKRWTLAGRSYAIHRKNNEMCAVIAST